MKNYFLLCTLLAGFGSLALFGQTIDPSFSPVFRSGGTGLNVVAQPDDRLLVSGRLSLVGTTPTRDFVRLLPDGGIDPSFSYAASLLNAPRAIGLQADGKIVIAGGINNQNNEPAGAILRLLPDGSIDESFQIVPDSGLIFEQIEILPDQRIFAYYFREPIDNEANSLIYGIRLYEPDGQPAAEFPGIEFTPAAGAANSSITSIGVQPSGALLVFGTQLPWNGVTQNAFRFASNGTVDPDFNPAIVSNGNFISGDIAVHPDGAITLIAGDARTLNFLDSSGVVLSTRQLAGQYYDVDPLADTTGFSLYGINLACGSRSGVVKELSNQQGPNGFIRDATLQGERLVLVGPFSRVGVTPTAGIARYNVGAANLTLETSFTGQLFRPGLVRAIVEQPDGKLVAGGDFESVNGQRMPHLVRLNVDGSVDGTFNAAGIDRTVSVRGLEALADGTLVVISQKTDRFPQSLTDGLTLLTPDGAPIQRLPFPFFGNVGTLTTLAVDSLNRIFAGEGLAYFVNGVAGQELVRYSRAGSDYTQLNYNEVYIDSLFRYNGLYAQPEGRLLIYGRGIKYAGSTVMPIVKADSTGARDTSFTTDLPANFFATTVAPGDSQTLFVAGRLPTVPGGFQYIDGGLYKLDSTGKVVADFSEDFSKTGEDYYDISFVERLPTGEMLVSGTFDSYRNESVPSGRVLLRPDGTFVREFLPTMPPAQFTDFHAIDSNSVYLAGELIAPTGAVGIIRVDLPLTSSVADFPQLATGMTLFPNPVTGASVNCRLEGVTPGGRLPYRLYDLATGRQVHSGTVIGAPQLDIPLGERLPTGRYVLVLKDGSRTYAAILIKQ